MSTKEKPIAMKAPNDQEETCIAFVDKTSGSIETSQKRSSHGPLLIPAPPNQEIFTEDQGCKSPSPEFTYAMTPEELHINPSEWGHVQTDIVSHAGQAVTRMLVGPPH